MLPKSKVDHLEAGYTGPGLTEQAAQHYQTKYGANVIPETRRRPLVGILSRMWGPTP